MGVPLEPHQQVAVGQLQHVPGLLAPVVNGIGEEIGIALHLGIAVDAVVRGAAEVVVAVHQVVPGRVAIEPGHSPEARRHQIIGLELKDCGIGLTRHGVVRQGCPGARRMIVARQPVVFHRGIALFFQLAIHVGQDGPGSALRGDQSSSHGQKVQETRKGDDKIAVFPARQVPQATTGKGPVDLPAGRFPVVELAGYHEVVAGGVHQVLDDAIPAWGGHQAPGEGVLEISSPEVVPQYAGVRRYEKGIAPQVEVQDGGYAEGEVAVGIGKTVGLPIPAQLQHASVLPLPEGRKGPVPLGHNAEDGVQVQVDDVDLARGGQMNDLDHAPGFGAAQPEPFSRDGQCAQVGVN